MSVNLDDRFFDLTMKIVNYSLEFVDQPSYASLRLTDVLESLVSLSSSIEGVNRREFYEKIHEKLMNRIGAEDRSALLNDILALYIEEWRSDSH